MSNLKSNEIRWGIIGAGDVCEVKSGPAFNRIKNSGLVAVMRRDGRKAEDYARRHQVPKWYDDADKLIHDPDVNAVYIATPPDSHKEYTLRVADAGKPVYVEKPMARSYQECLTMIEACQKAGVALFVAYYRRMLPNFLKIKELLDQGSIGDVRLVDVKLYKTPEPNIVGASGSRENWRIFPEIAGGGYFYDLASHQLDFLDYLFGPVAEARGLAHNQAGLYPAEDIVTGSFRFENGVLGQGSWCFTVSGVSDREITAIIGSKGQITFSYFGGWTVTLETEGREKEIFTFAPIRHIQQPLIQTIVDALQGKGTCPSTGVSGARTNQVMEWLCDRIT
ncbi:MAG: Gfo/Idh/MocA family oxidoreductase [Cyclobacteriaceae bacterium]|nr:Gfo/Idh/MocA family oxidoreductase [Cyclobacteriaceae bacterium]